MSKRVLPQQALGEDGGPASKVAKEVGTCARSLPACVPVCRVCTREEVQARTHALTRPLPLSQDGPPGRGTKAAGVSGRRR